MPSQTWALIPMKRFDRAKSRLREQLSDLPRSALAQRMFERVLRAASECEAIGRTAVITNGDDVAELAERAGALVLRDAPQPAPTLGLLLDDALLQLHALGAARAVVLMGDLPDLDALEVARLAHALADFDVALSPDRRGTCTNALALRLPAKFASAFGDPDSYRAHWRRARELGLRACEVEGHGIARDVDTPEDLDPVQPRP